MIVLGLDPSLSAYGWAVHDSNKKGPARRIASGHEGTLPSTVPVARFMHFRALVGSLLNRYHVDSVGIESPAYQAGPFQRIHFGLMMFSLEEIFNRRKDCVLYDPATLKLLAREDSKKFKGTMGKLDMQRKVQLDTMDAGVIDNNEADAYLVAKFSARLGLLLRGVISPQDLTPSESAVFVARTRRVKTVSGVITKKVAHIFRENSRYFNFSKIPPGEVSLPTKSAIRPDILQFLQELEDSEEPRTKKV